MINERVRNGMITVIGTAAVIGATVAFASGLDKKGESSYRAMDAAQYTELAAAAKSQLGGDIVKIKREDDGYEIKVRQADGDVREYEVYAETDGTFRFREDD